MFSKKSTVFFIREGKMKKSFLLFILLAAWSIFFITGCKQQQNNATEKPVTGKFDEVLNFMESKLREYGVPGGAIAVINNGSLS